jgi:uncharacterized SAM-dependent methyltransferase
MHLVSARRQEVRVAGETVVFEAGETLHTENSYKFTLEGFNKLAASAGWRLEREWASAHPAFAVVRLVS